MPQTRQDRYFACVNPKPAAPAPPTPASGGGFDISNLLKIIQNVPQQQPAQQAPMSDLERTVSMLRQQQSQAPQAPQVPASQPQMPNIDLQKILSVMTAQQQMQPASMAPQPQQSQPGMTSNLNNLFATFAGPNQQAGAQLGRPQGHEYEDPDRKRLLESSGYDEQYDDRFSRSKRTRGPMSHVSTLFRCLPLLVYTPYADQFNSPRLDPSLASFGAKESAGKAKIAPSAMIFSEQHRMPILLFGLIDTPARLFPLSRARIYGIHIPYASWLCICPRRILH